MATDPAQQDLDAFLTSIESKLRVPFSSLDLVKAVTTSALRGSQSAPEYLEKIAQVLPRTDKVIRNRILIGLLGLDANEDTDVQVEKILVATQEAPLHEEWVRVISGLVQGLMFQEENGVSLRGQEASTLLERTCNQILRKVRKVEEQTSCASAFAAATADADPTFAPFRYALIGPNLLRRSIPEIFHQSSFAVDREAKVLLVDARLELAKAQEEQEHAKQTGVASKRAASTSSDSNGSNAKERVMPIMPGIRSTKASSISAARSSTGHQTKASMFMPSKKPSIVRPGVVSKVALHVRKKGASQALVGKSKLIRDRVETNGAARTAGVVPIAHPGRAGKSGNSRSRMQMIDIAEVQGMEEERKVRGETAATPNKEGGLKKSGIKRKAESAEQSEKLVKAKLGPQSGVDMQPSVLIKDEPKTVGDVYTKTPHAMVDALAAGALAAYQARLASALPQTAAPVALPAAILHAPKQQDWHQLLKEKSNKLSSNDRFRVQQFFQDRFNPTPGQTTYKMKLHEERTADAKSGDPVKETYYLELDYTNFTSKQSKKVKRYKDGVT
jgi:hypothetical protein